jgi:hypothetical protein
VLDDRSRAREQSGARRIQPSNRIAVPHTAWIKDVWEQHLRFLKKCSVSLPKKMTGAQPSSPLLGKAVQCAT